MVRKVKSRPSRLPHRNKTFKAIVIYSGIPEEKLSRISTKSELGTAASSQISLGGL